ncbi:rhomboid-like protein [Streptomyces sp. NPDC006602]|uniref:rhomboid-like protein n=1 Tax=Streptomyces sp. NPDC006602 TaxID=3364751 RepID=UPI0036B5E12E
MGISPCCQVGADEPTGFPPTECPASEMPPPGEMPSETLSPWAAREHRVLRVGDIRTGCLLLPTPAGTPFTFGYAVILAVTSLVTECADPVLVHDLHQASSTDVAHLVQTPVLVLLASALWIAGGILSPYAMGLLLVLTALERRIGGLRTAGVFLLGHVLATLGTEVPVGLAVLVGHLPDSSLHRLDYGVSFGVAAGVGALAGLLTRWLRWPLLAVFGGMLVQGLLAFTDPLTDWGHLMAFAIGIGTWPVVRGWYRARTASRDRRCTVVRWSRWAGGGCPGGRGCAYRPRHDRGAGRSAQRGVGVCVQR